MPIMTGSACGNQVLATFRAHGKRRQRTLLLMLCALGLGACGGDSDDDDDDVSPTPDSEQITWTRLEEAFEIVDAGTVATQPEQPLSTYKSGDDPAVSGDNEIGAEAWVDYQPPPPYLKNTTRNLQFNESSFIASPGAPDGTTTYVMTSDGYTWAFMSRAINALWPYDPADYTGLPAVNAYYAGNLVVTPPAGVVKITANFKAQYMKFWASEDGQPLARYFVTDQWGNEYIMHASGQTDQSQVAAAFEAAELPAGWSKFTRTLDEDLILSPAEGADGSYHYLVWRDSADNTYHQIGWGDGGSLAAQVPGMPIWGGQGNDILPMPTDPMRDDLLHAADGDDIVIAGPGNDEIWGDAGSDTVVLPGNRDAHALVDHNTGENRLVISDGTYTRTLYHVEFLEFDDMTVSVAEFAGG